MLRIGKRFAQIFKRLDPINKTYHFTPATGNKLKTAVIITTLGVSSPHGTILMLQHHGIRVLKTVHLTLSELSRPKVIEKYLMDFKADLLFADEFRREKGFPAPIDIYAMAAKVKSAGQFKYTCVWSPTKTKDHRVDFVMKYDMSNVEDIVEELNSRL